MNITSNTLSIHLFNASWLSTLDKLINRIEGNKKNNPFFKFRRVISFPFRFINKFKKNGFSNTMKYMFGKLH